MNIKISDYAKLQIHLIFSYYKETASETVAHKIIGQIQSAIQKLKDFPEIGQVDSFMKKHGKSYRRIVEGNYKIIYKIEGDEIRISDVFDARQRPDKQNP